MKGLLFTFCIMLLSVSAILSQESRSAVVDEFSDPNCEDIWARLDYFRVQINNNPTANVTISIADKRGDIRGNLYYEAMIRNYLVTRKVPQDRWRIIRTGPHSSRVIRFWLTPLGAPAPNIDAANWSLEYPAETKPFIFTHGKNYMVDVSVCLDVDELELLAKFLDANPLASTNIVVLVRSDSQFVSRKRRILEELVEGYSMNRNRIRFFKRIDRRPNPYGIRSDTEYWFVP